MIRRYTMAAALIFSVFLMIAIGPVASSNVAAFLSVSGSTIKSASSPSIIGVGARRVSQHSLTSCTTPTLMLSSSATPCYNSFGNIRNDIFASRATYAVGIRTHHARDIKKTQLHASPVTAGSNNSNINFSILLASAISRRGRIISEVKTLFRVLLPAIISGMIASISLPALSQHVTKFVLLRGGGGGMLSDVVTSFISLIGLLYSILMGQVFGFLYTQQEALYYALFDEVTEAKSLLEQVALVSRGRTMYSTCLSSIERYVKDDLLDGTTLTQTTSPTSSSSAPTPSSSSVTPSLILSARPADDPLEAILYLTSVGLPGQIYDTVRSLRQARSRRLGALQRKVPVIHLLMLWILGLIMISSFPVLIGVGGAQGVVASTTATAGISKACSLQCALFGVATFAVVMAKMVLGELWRTKGGAYNVDSVLRVMVRGLQKELNERMIEAQMMMKRSNTNDVKSVREKEERMTELYTSNTEKVAS